MPLPLAEALVSRMRAVVQRVRRAAVRVGDRSVGEIGAGLLAFVGVASEDGPADVQYIASKIRDCVFFPTIRER